MYIFLARFIDAKVHFDAALLSRLWLWKIVGGGRGHCSRTHEAR